MRLTSRLSSFFLVSLFLLTGTSCSKKNDSFLVEYSLRGNLVDLTFDEMKEKVNTLDHMILFINSSTCSACDMVKEDFLIDYIEESKLKIYSYETNQVDTKLEGEYLKSIVPEGSSYITDCYDENDNKFPCFYIPLMLIIENGKTIKDALGTKAINKKFIESNVSVDKKKKYSVNKDEIYQIEYAKETTFTKYEGQEEGIIYHTSSLENNDEVKYYLNPFMEDFHTSIYLDLDSKNEDSYLEVKTSSTSVKESKRTSYLSFLDAYTHF